MEISDYITWGFIIFIILFFTSAVLALNWAYKSGQFDKLDEDAHAIFDDEEEPEGVVNDRFPDRRKSQKPKNK